MSAPRRVLLLVLSLIALPLAAQTTGSIAGRATDSGGGALPGVSVEAKSPSLQGTRTAMSDPAGVYRLPLLPPGQYQVTFRLEGFAPEARRVDVLLGKEAPIDVAMRISTATEITVTAAAPVLDPESTTLGTNLGARAIETLPTGRNYASIVQVAPGVSSDANPENNAQDRIAVYGSSGAENSYYIDGVNTTNLEYGFQGKELNFEFIREVDVKTGGYEAEFGRSTGGIINVITKSGGNTFSGDVFGYYDNDSLQANAKRLVTATPLGFTKEDFGADAGGYLMKDTLWFFAAYDRVHNTTKNSLTEGPAAGQITTSSSRRNLGSAKLTWNAGANQSLVASFLQDPRVDSGAINDPNHRLNGDPLTYLGRQDLGGRDYALRYDGSFRSNWIIVGQAAHHGEKNSVGPATSAGDVIEYRDAENDFFQTGGFGLMQDKKFGRNFFGASAERYLGTHQIKGGVEYERETAKVVKRMSGGQQVDVFANKVNPAKPIYRHFYWTTADATLANAPVAQLTASPQHHNTTAYLQDKWTLKNFVVNYGIRWDRQEIIDAGGVKQIDLKRDLAPRLGVVWDPRGDRRSKVFASYGRYYESIPMDLVIRSFSYERQPRIINYDPKSVTPNPAAEKDYGTPSAILGGSTEPSDPHLKNQYLTEILVGGEREVAANLSVGVKGIYRSYGRVIEDFLCMDDGTYCIGNPGQGIMKRIFTLDYSTTFPAPKPKRTYKGIQLDATRRYADHWQAMASYIFSKLDGNYDGEYSPFTNVGADPNISAAYDYYDFFTDGTNLGVITNRGPLSNDRKHQLKVSGVYETPWRLSVGAAAYWRSGTPLTAMGFSDAYGRYEFFLTPRGALGRNPSNYEVDVHLGYPIAAGGATVNVLLDVFSLLNSQRPVLLDQRFGAAPNNADFLQPALRTQPMTARLGVRVSF
jgi:hypothetical protein